MIRLNRPGKGEALSAAERAAPPGPLLLCDADLEGTPAARREPGPTRGRLIRGAVGGGFGIAKGSRQPHPARQGFAHGNRFPGSGIE